MPVNATVTLVFLAARITHGSAIARMVSEVHELGRPETARLRQLLASAVRSDNAVIRTFRAARVIDREPTSVCRRQKVDNLE